MAELGKESDMTHSTEAEREAVARYGDYDPLGVEGTDPRVRCFIDGAEWALWVPRPFAGPSFAEVEAVLNAWLLEDKGPSEFDRGLHLLSHLKRGGTLEEYGLPPAADGGER
jgi:hypothetical protein